MVNTNERGNQELLMLLLNYTLLAYNAAALEGPAIEVQVMYIMHQQSWKKMQKMTGADNLTILLLYYHPEHSHSNIRIMFSNI